MEKWASDRVSGGELDGMATGNSGLGFPELRSALKFDSRKPYQGITTRGSHGCSLLRECWSLSEPSSNDGGATLWANGQLTHKAINFRTSMKPFGQSGKEPRTLRENSEKAHLQTSPRENLHGRRMWVGSEPATLFQPDSASCI